MAGYYSPRIVTSNIALHLDAGNQKSYPRSGTVWADLSGGGYHASMYGTVPYGIDVAPCFDFGTASGTFSYNVNMGFTFSSNMIPTSGNFTLSCWIKNPPAGIAQVGLFSNAGGANGYRFGVSLGYAYYLMGAGDNTYKETQMAFSSVCSASLWYNIALVYGRSTNTMTLYRNGVLQATDSISGVSQAAFSPSTPGIVRSACCNVYTGKLASFLAYGRALSADEVLLNFDAMKGRFGY